MNKITTVGLDLAKQVFHVVGVDRHEKEVTKKMLRRNQVLAYFAKLPPCLIGMEACAGAHDWARRLKDLGHEVRLISPRFVKAYVRGNKNDYNDARAIAEAARRPGMRCVAVKTVEQQDRQALHRLRAARVAERTALCNQLRGLLAEYGVVAPKGVATLRRRIPEWLEDAEAPLTPMFRQLLHRAYQQLTELDGHVEFYTGLIEQQARESEAQRRLQTVPGFGPIVASMFHATVGDATAYRRGRDVSAALGLVPRQHSSGGKEVLLGISKRGDPYLRSLLVHGARAVLRQAHRKDDRLSRWVVKLKAERGANKAAVALANKLARIGWAVLRQNTVYHPA
ncbi:MAG: IS110 family transposase [Roseovarius sp.]|nr:IS110 family transposase [Roseovarius sp.]